ncbi:MAG: hypothetical protein LIO87_01525 [Eubacterium sp.]|nr:hypothetical protein [Eubacterium sp.]
MTFQDLTFKKKIEHIWEYYKVPILGTILVIFILGSWIYNAKFKPHKELFSGVAMLNYKLPEEKGYTDPLYDAINSELGLTDTNYEVKVEYFYDDPNEPDMLSTMLEKFAAMLLAGDVNIMIMDKDSMEEYAYEDYLLNLALVYSLDDLEKMEEEGLVLSTSSELDPIKHYYAISLKNSTMLKDLPGFDLENSYIAIYGASPEPYNPKQVVDLLIN